MRSFLSLSFAALVACESSVPSDPAPIHHHPATTGDGPGGEQADHSDHAGGGSGLDRGEEGESFGGSPASTKPDESTNSGGAPGPGGSHHSGAADGGGGRGSTSTGGDASGEAGGGPPSGGNSSGGAHHGTPAHDCLDFEDHTAPDAPRLIAWNFDLGPERCMKVKRGQIVTWSGNFSRHPLTALEPSLGQAISSSDPTNALHTWTFEFEGTFSYVCEQHLEMRGAIVVVP